MTTYGITAQGMTVYRDGKPIAEIPVTDIPLLIERLARAWREANS